MPATELAEWGLFYAQHPFGEIRADLRSGIIASTIARYVGGNRNARPSDFMPLLHEKGAAGSRASQAAAEAAAVNNALMKASSRLKHNFIRRKG
jgi:Protein of unknown function (DUF4035)